MKYLVSFECQLKPNYSTKFDTNIHEKMHNHDLFGTFFRIELSVVLFKLYCVQIFQLRMLGTRYEIDLAIRCTTTTLASLTGCRYANEEWGDRGMGPWADISEKK